MRICSLLIPLLVLLLFCGVQAANYQVMVLDSSTEPEVLMKGDTGIIKIRVVNNGDAGVLINRAVLFGGEFSVPSDPYPTVGWLGAGNSMDFTFTVKGGNEDGLFYPRFVLEFSDGASLRYAVPVRVDSTDLTLALEEKPEYVTIGETVEYGLLVGNPRPNGVSGVQVFPEGQGFEVTPSTQFIGALDSDEQVRVSFNITPDRITQVRFRVSYRNGITEHQSAFTIPVLPSENKKAAEPLISNIQVSQEGNIYRIIGDVTNAGLFPAKSVVIRTDTPAIPTDPYRSYVVGSLDPDDFSSFEVTFTLPRSGNVPLLVEYKDADGNRFIRQEDVKVDISPLVDEGSTLPKIGTLLVWLVVLIIGAAIVYSWRKR
jgi:hypothetical protein